ncbi:putative zinc finger protein [Cryptosporidium felis]|nr:putative zinc finger protein [Cryptosporidium felis]
MIKNKLTRKQIKKLEKECRENFKSITESMGKEKGVIKDSSTAESIQEKSELSQDEIKSRSAGIYTEDKTDTTTIANKILSEFTCPICLEYFILPVTIPCGHTFCRYCITHNRLLGKNCPICRQLIGYNFKTNMAIHNVIVALGIFEHLDYLKNYNSDIEEQYLSLKRFSAYSRPKWWQLCFCKPIISVTLFARIISDEVLGIGIIFAEDLTRCIIDRFSKLSTINNPNLREVIWSNGIYMIGPLEIDLLTRWIGCPPLPFELNENNTGEKSIQEFTLNNNEIFKNQVKKWVEGCVSLKPTILNIGQNPFLNTTTHPIIRILNDRIHRVESKIYDLGLLRSPLPWDLGRHSKSTIQISHSSVSTNHLLIVNIKEHNQVAHELNAANIENYDDEIESVSKDWGIGIIDLGSSIGTMLKIQSDHRLGTEEIIHLADRVEIIIKIQQITEIDDDMLDSVNKPQFDEWKKLRWSKKLNLVINLDEYNKDNLEQTEGLADDSIEYSAANCNETSEDTSKSVENRIMQIPTEELELEEIDEYLEVYIPVCLKGSIPCDGAVKTENGCYWSVIVHPSGMVFGRGRNGALGLKKVEVTENNGYISREHCIFYYSKKDIQVNDYLCRPKTKLSNWYIKDISTSGTFLRLKPFSYPLRLLPGMALKVGQCKMEVLPNQIGAFYSGYSNQIDRDSIPANFSSPDIQTLSNSSDIELLQTQLPNLNQASISFIGNTPMLTQFANNPYLTNINNNLIAQMNILATYNYLNTSSGANLLSSSNLLDYNYLMLEGRINQTRNTTVGRLINDERTIIEHVLLQNLLSSSIIGNNTISTNAHLENLNDEDNHNTGNSLNSLQANNMFIYERRPREPRVTQEGDISFRLEGNGTFDNEC